MFIYGQSVRKKKKERNTFWTLIVFMLLFRMSMSVIVSQKNLVLKQTVPRSLVYKVKKKKKCLEVQKISYNTIGLSGLSQGSEKLSVGTFISSKISILEIW